MDENVPIILRETLERIGYDVKTVIDDYVAGARNSEVAYYALDEERVVITLDKDFLKVKQEVQKKVRVVVVDVHPATTDAVTRVIEQFISEGLERLQTKERIVITKMGIIEP